MLEHIEYKAASGCLLTASVSPTISCSKESFVHGRVLYIAEKSPRSDEYSSPDNSPSEENNAAPTSMQNVKKKQLVSGVNDRRVRGTKSCLEKVEQTTGISKGKSAQFKLQPIDNLSKPNYELQRHRFPEEQLVSANWKKNILLRHTSDLTSDHMSVKLQQGMTNSPVTPAPLYYPSSSSCGHYTTSVHDCTASMMPCKFQDVCAANVQAPQFHVPSPEIVPALSVSSGPQPNSILSPFKCPSTKFLKPSTSLRSDTVPFPRVRSTQKKVTSD